jgi:trimethylamine--corrinoid protein Co-methyltransferase
VTRGTAYRALRNPFPPAGVFSDDRVEAIHDTALRVLEELGLKVLLPEARRLFADAGAIVDEDSAMVRIGRDVVAAAIASAPARFHLRGGAPSRDVAMDLGALAFVAGGGCPNASDAERGRRPGTLRDFEELVRLAQQFDVLHMMSPSVEPQDVPTPLRHYAVTRIQLALSDKVPFVYARGTAQAEDAFEMIRVVRGLDAAAFAAEPRTYTIINTNSPRQLDVPMSQGLIDFARAGQLAIVTPFCLAGAMAPITVAGALTLSHAEALAAICLSQLARPGAPVCYGAFPSNVDMKSGAPAFGTPEHVKATLGAGQLARHVGLPWRGSAGCAANVNDTQAAHETQMSAWASVLAGCTVLVHGAGWLEGGLTLCYEKLITDLEMLQTFAELCAATAADEDAIAFDAIAEVAPGGHFFETAQTMRLYASAFYEPLVADWSNFGTWSEAGGRTSNERAHDLWRRTLDAFEPPPVDPGRLEDVDAFIARRTQEGGAPPPD